MATGGTSTTTLDGREIIKEGWLTVYKSRNSSFFLKQKPDKVLERAWAVIHAQSPKGPLMSFFQDNRKETRVLKKDKVEMLSVREITKLINHPKLKNCFTLKIKGKRNRLLFNCDTLNDLQLWITSVSNLLRQEFKMEKVIWEFLDIEGLWQAISDRECYEIEARYADEINSFDLGESDSSIRYNISSHQRSITKNRQNQRIKRTPFVWERPEALHQKMLDLPAIWEWGDPSKDEWHPFERATNIQIEDMYDSGSQWAELTLCMPSPMLLLLNLRDMKLVNSRTSLRYSLRRIDNSANMVQDDPLIDQRSPSPDYTEDQQMDNAISPISPLFQSLQSCLEHLQIPREQVECKQLLGEGAFGEVYLGKVVLPGDDHTSEVAVKQLRLSDFIARHGHHSQQMEDFLREAKEMAKVRSHRVVKLMAVCTLSYPLLLIEEYMNQGDLLGVLKDSRPSMSLVQQLSFAYQVADGMNYLAEELQCVHRDLAARNVMVQKNENEEEMVAKIADFGLSRHLYSEMYKHQGNKPRPLPAKWMALESLMYFVFTTKSDVWSFGVLLWEIMTLGRTPYPGVENRELLEQIEEKGLRLNKPKSCPNVIYAMILECTNHEPDDRPKFLKLRDTLHDLYKDAKEGKLVHDTTPRDSVIDKEGSQGSTTTGSDKQTSDEKTETEPTTASDGNTNKESIENPAESSNDVSTEPCSSDAQKIQLEGKEDNPGDGGDGDDGDGGDHGGDSDGGGDGDGGGGGDHGDSGDGGDGGDHGGDGDNGDGGDGDSGSGDNGDSGDTVTVTTEKTTDKPDSDEPLSPQHTSGDHKEEEEPKTDDITATDSPDSAAKEGPQPIARENTPVEATPPEQTVTDSKAVDQNLPISPKTNSLPSPEHKANSDTIHLEEIEIGVFGTNSCQKTEEKECDFEIESETGHLYYVIDPDDIRELKVTSKKSNNDAKLHHTTTDQSNQSILSPPPNGTIPKQLS